MTVQKDLCQIFMTPLNEAVRSFIKIIGYGTGLRKANGAMTPMDQVVRPFIKIVESGAGLGKTYGAIESFSGYIKSNPKEKTLSLFTSPQHNQISFPDLIKNKFTKNGVQVIKTKPF
jgi:hypothetical protein